MENFGPSYLLVMSWRPLRPTVVLIGDVAIGLTVYDVSDYVNTRFDWSTSKQYTRQADGYERPDMPIVRLAIRFRGVPPCCVGTSDGKKINPAISSYRFLRSRTSSSALRPTS